MPDKERDFIALLVIVAVLIVILPVLMWVLWGLWGGHMYSSMGGMMGYGGGFMSVLPFTFLVLIAQQRRIKANTRSKYSRSAMHGVKSRVKSTSR